MEFILNYFAIFIFTSGVWGDPPTPTPTPTPSQVAIVVVEETPTPKPTPQPTPDLIQCSCKYFVFRGKRWDCWIKRNPEVDKNCRKPDRYKNKDLLIEVCGIYNGSPFEPTGKMITTCRYPDQGLR